MLPESVYTCLDHTEVVGQKTTTRVTVEKVYTFSWNCLVMSIGISNFAHRRPDEGPEHHTNQNKQQ